MPIGRLTTKSKFFINFEEWERSGRNVRQELAELVCDECRQMYPLDQERVVDHLDPVTGEVTRMDALLDCASDLCASSPDFVSPKMPLQRAIVRALIAAGNSPQSPEEIFARIKKGSPQVILKELLSAQMELDGIAPA